MQHHYYNNSYSVIIPLVKVFPIHKFNSIFLGNCQAFGKDGKIYICRKSLSLHEKSYFAVAVKGYRTCSSHEAKYITSRNTPDVVNRFTTYDTIRIAVCGFNELLSVFCAFVHFIFSCKCFSYSSLIALRFELSLRRWCHSTFMWVVLP